MNEEVVVNCLNLRCVRCYKELGLMITGERSETHHREDVTNALEAAGAYVLCNPCRDVMTKDLRIYSHEGIER